MGTPTPPVVSVGFGVDGGRNVIPVTNDPLTGAASYDLGFPPLTRTPLVEGGIPPSGLDMNGVLYALGANTAWVTAGGQYVYQADVVTNQAGYNIGARLQSADSAVASYTNLTADNTADPDSDLTGWSQDQDLVTPFDFGAIGDGVADDTVAVQAWLDTGGQLYGTRGNFRITARINVTVSGTKIEGRGMRIFHDTTTIESVFRASQLSNLAFVGLEIDGMKSLKTPIGVANAYGIELDRCGQSTVDSCYVHDCTEHAIRIGETAGGLGVSANNFVRGNLCKENGNVANGRGWGIWLFGQVRGICVTGNICLDNIGGGISIDDSSSDLTPNVESFYFAIAGNVIRGPAARTANSSAISISGSRYGTCAGNVATGYLRGAAISSVQVREQSGLLACTGNYLEGEESALELKNCQYVTCSGNALQGNGTTAGDCAVTISGAGSTTPDSHCKQIVVSGNSIRANLHGIRIDVSSDLTSEEVSVLGNRVEYIGIAALMDQTGIRTGSPAGTIEISNNTVVGFYDGIYFSSVAPAIARYNTVRGCGNFGVRIANATSNIIEGNVCSANVANDLRIEATANVAGTIVRNNNFASATAINSLSTAIRSWQNVGYDQQGSLLQTVVLAAGTTNNQAITVTTGCLDLDTTAGAATVTGFVSGFNGQRVTITCTGAASLTLAALSGSSTAANQIRMSSNLTLLQYDSCTLVYSTGAGKWLLG